jgi:geranylgeranyl diphosphate synthase type II
LGERLGEAYQVADDIRDVAGNAEDLGKPVGRDVALGRPSAAGELGIEGAVKRLEQLVAEAIASIPSCPGAAELRGVIQLEAERLLPKGVARRAA